jgi:hypothetical protein
LPQAVFMDANTSVSTVKPVYNGNPWDLKKVAVLKRLLIKLKFRLVVDDSNWPLLTGDRYSEVVVKTGLTIIESCLLVQHIEICVNIS